METVHCSDCGENVSIVKRQVADKQSRVVQACDCTEAPRSASPYEVDSWEWISYDG